MKKDENKKTIILTVLFVAVTGLLMGTASAATGIGNWKIDESTKYGYNGNNIITRGIDQNFVFCGIQAYKGKISMKKTPTGYFHMRGGVKNFKIKEVKLRIYNLNTHKYYIKSFKGNNKYI